MKISLSSIIISHWDSLKDVGEEKISTRDIFIFYGIPFIVGGSVSLSHAAFPKEIYSVSISVFSIFSALLFSAQVAMYGVFRSDRKIPSDVILAEDERKRVQDTRLLLREVNANISYLIFLSCLSVTVFLIFFAAELPAGIESGVSIFLYTHFLLTIAMVLKRAHEIFDAEYAKPIRFDDNG
ncbi:hypothetical protein [Paracoccus alkenifer]|uniref:hypothetical protein n=1 Tax=Paracoccus alkenifer TaxID=65735 RepID=UPI00115FAF79|nr:hypothetical protein [Paracoccus alkenifer]